MNFLTCHAAEELDHEDRVAAELLVDRTLVDRVRGDEPAVSFAFLMCECMSLSSSVAAERIIFATGIARSVLRLHSNLQS